MATILIDKNVMVPMRDGVRLATDVYRLDGAPPAPVLLARTPYDKEHTVAGTSTFDILRAVQAGNAVVIQDVRGRYASIESCGCSQPAQQRRDSTPRRAAIPMDRRAGGG